MRSQTKIGVVAAGVLLLAAGGMLLASNMSFKLTLLFPKAGTATGTSTFALPFILEPGLNNAKDLIDDVNANGEPPNSVERLEAWLPSSNAHAFYSGSPTDPPAFDLVPCTCYLIKVSEDVVYEVFGAHDNEQACTFLGLSASASGTSFFAPPYGTMAEDGWDLLQDMKNNGSPPDSIERLEYWLPASNSHYNYSGVLTDPAAPPFIPGECMWVKVGGSANVMYIPSHY